MNTKFKLGFGTAAIGRPQYINIKQTKATEFSLSLFKAKAIRILDEAYDKGIRYYDTAPGYGIAEEILIEWIQVKRDSTIEVATKWGYTYVANFNPDAKIHEVKEHSLAKLNQQWEKSKTLLPYLSTYQIHSATLDTGVLDDKNILHKLLDLKVENGLKIGLSVTGSNQIEVIKKALEIEVSGVQLFGTFQVTYNLFDQSLSGVISQLKGKRIIVKEALANGRVFPNSQYPGYTKAYELIQKLAFKYRVGIDAIALRFCIDSIDTFRVLSGASEVSHLTQNNQANTFKLLETEIKQLKCFAIQPDAYWTERKQLKWQ